MHFPEGVVIHEQDPGLRANADRDAAMRRLLAAAEAQQAKERARQATRDRARNARTSKRARAGPKTYRCGVDGEYVNGIFLPYGAAYFKNKVQGVFIIFVFFACLHLPFYLK